MRIPTLRTKTTSELTETRIPTFNPLTTSGLIETRTPTLRKNVMIERKENSYILLVTWGLEDLFTFVALTRDQNLGRYLRA